MIYKHSLQCFSMGEMLKKRRKVIEDEDLNVVICYLRVLSPEIWLQVFNWLDIVSLGKCIMTCTLFRSIIHDTRFNFNSLNYSQVFGPFVSGRKWLNALNIPFQLRELDISGIMIPLYCGLKKEQEDYSRPIKPSDKIFQVYYFLFR
jgi:hypothetical protein